MNVEFGQKLNRIFSDSDNARRLRRVRQKPPRVAEYILFAILPVMLAACAAFPKVAVVILPFIVPAMYVVYRRTGAYLPLFCIAAYGALSLALNYDILSVVYLCALFFSFAGVVFSAQISPVLASASAAAILGAVGTLGGVGVVRLAENKPVDAIAYDYVMQNANDPIVSIFARLYYKDAKLAPNIERLDPSHPDYKNAATIRFAEYVKEDLGAYYAYDCIHYGALLAVVGYVLSVVVNRKTSGRFDSAVRPSELAASTIALGGIGKKPPPLSDVRMPRAYLWTCALPATIAGVILQFIGVYPVLSAVFMHAFVTLPCAFGCFTLFMYFASLFRGKAVVCAYALFVTIGVAAVVIPLVLFILSVIGVCDCILNLRFWTEFIRK